VATKHGKQRSHGKRDCLDKGYATTRQIIGIHCPENTYLFLTAERTINVARLYEIRDGTRGAHIQAASENELHQFLSRFDLERPPREEQELSLRYRPVPAYLGVHEGRVCLLTRAVHNDDERLTLRRNLASEQRRLANLLAQDWLRFQVDQRLRAHMETYAALASQPDSMLNIFSLDDEFRVIRRSVGAETGGFGEIGEAHWDNFSRNHAVLTELYPEMRDYRASLAATSPRAELAEDEARRATGMLLDADSQRYVAPEVPDLIQKHLDEDTDDDPEASRKRAYDVAALLNTVGALTFSIINLLPQVAKATDAAHSLQKRLWPPLRTVLEKMEWW
jgi:hypothetical protein